MALMSDRSSRSGPAVMPELPLTEPLPGDVKLNLGNTTFGISGTLTPGMRLIAETMPLSMKLNALAIPSNTITIELPMYLNALMTDPVLLMSNANDATMPAIATTTMPMGLAVSAKLNAICAAVATLIAVFKTRIAADNAPTPTISAVTIPVFSCANLANDCSLGSNFSRMGKNAAPMDSLVSAIVSDSLFIWPSALLAAVAAAPPTVNDSSFII